MLETITPLILTYNEEPNIKRTLDRLSWARRIIVIDSYSTDRTLEIVADYPQVEVFQHPFESHARQWNYGLSHVDSEWVLSLDADYVVSDMLLEELRGLTPQPDINGYAVNFEYCVFGKPLKGTLLPPRKALYRKAQSSYKDDGHTQRVCIKGKTGSLKACLFHDDRKSLSHWLWAQDRYMIIESQKLLNMPDVQLSLSDRLRKQKVLAPFIVLIYCLILKGGILDGWRGCYYAFQRMLAETLLSIHLIKTQTSPD